MKKLYATLLTSLFTINIATAQLSLTKANNEPIVGNSNTFSYFDSAGVVPRNTGTNQVWDFTAFTQNTITSSSMYTSTTAVASATAFAGATLVEDRSNSNYNFWKSTATQFELLGVQTGTTVTLNFTNSAIAVVWPINYGYNQSDAFAGNANTSFGNGTVTGNINTKGVGTGTLTIPGGTVFTNILQTVTSQTVNLLINVGIGTATLNVKSTDYSYYSGTNKFPLLTSSYQKNTSTLPFSSPTITTTSDVKVNNAVLLGLTNYNIDANYNIYPNPASNFFNVSLTNNSGYNASITIYNALGQIVRTYNLGSQTVIEKNISIADLKSGIYIVKTNLGNKSSSRRLIVE